jgi:adenosyl cobinamide kinase/adenosyl cobinamide phosphate guanylyltransferase
VITLVLGGARSGKSALAERLVLAHPGALLYLATGRAAGDADMADRIERHRRRRDPRFTTIETDDLTAALDGAAAHPMLVDALGTWVASRPEFSPVDERAGDADWSSWWDQQISDLCRALTDRAGRGAATVLVSDEVGLGVHPESSAGRRFRDVLGTVNQRVAAVADDAVLVVAGRVLRLDRPTSLDILDEPLA